MNKPEIRPNTTVVVGGGQSLFHLHDVHRRLRSLDQIGTAGCALAARLSETVFCCFESGGRFDCVTSISHA